MTSRAVTAQHRQPAPVALGGAETRRKRDHAGFVDEPRRRRRVARRRRAGRARSPAPRVPASTVAAAASASRSAHRSPGRACQTARAARPSPKRGDKLFAPAVCGPPPVSTGATVTGARLARRFLFDVGVSRRDRQPQDVGAGARVARGDGVDQSAHVRGQHPLRGDHPVQPAQLADMVCVRASFEDERVDEPAVEPHPHPHAGLRVVGLLRRRRDSRIRDPGAAPTASAAPGRSARAPPRSCSHLPSSRRIGRPAEKEARGDQHQRCGIHPPDRHRQRLGPQGRTCRCRSCRPTPRNTPHPAPSTASAAGPAVPRTPSRRAPRCRAVTGMAMPSAISSGQNQISSATHATTMTAAAPRRGADRTNTVGAARPGSTDARRGRRASPSTNDGSHHGIASRKSPAAENPRARRSASGVPCATG